MKELKEAIRRRISDLEEAAEVLKDEVPRVAEFDLIRADELYSLLDWIETKERESKG